MRRATIDEEKAGAMISTSTFGEEAKSKPTPEAGLLSREATAAIGSVFNTLTETVKKYGADTGGCGSRNASSHAQVVAGRTLAQFGGTNGRGRNRTGHSRTLTTIPR